jgi:CubicO group peptidase (beta-lactamase class C family)
MTRRTFLGAAAASLGASAAAGRWDEAEAVLDRAVESRQVAAAVLAVVRKGEAFTRHFGAAKTADAMFLLGSISKPINVAAVMTLFDRGEFKLDDPIAKFIPEFTGGGRETVTVKHVLTHTSGLPDQLANNNELRKQHAPLTEFVKQTAKTKLEFEPGTKYQYSSVGILLAARMGELITGLDLPVLLDQAVFTPLGMKHSAQGLGRLKLEDVVSCQMEGAAPESGGGDPKSAEWNWNSAYWRKLGAPWGGTHASAPDVASFLAEFLGAAGKVLKPGTARLMTKNHNAAGLTPRGLGFAVGKAAGSAGCSDRTFGHTGSTGTLCWADPAAETICVVLTSLPSRAEPHPRQAAAEKVAGAMNQP